MYDCLLPLHPFIQYAFISHQGLDRHWGVNTKQHKQSPCPYGGGSSVGKAGVLPRVRLSVDRATAHKANGADGTGAIIGSLERVPP